MVILNDLALCIGWLVLVVGTALFVAGCVMAGITHWGNAKEKGFSDGYHKAAGEWIARHDEACAEVARLRRGEFTDVEFQNLCHNLHEKGECMLEAFDGGCQEYQKKLFGRCVPRVTEES